MAYMGIFPVGGKSNSSERTLQVIASELALAASAGDAVRFAELTREHAHLTGQARPAKPVSPHITQSTAIGAKPEAAPKPVDARPRRQARLATLPAVDRLPASWSDAFRGMPNELIRTGLFNIRRSEPRATLKDVVVAATRDTTVLYSGEELRIRDEDVLMQIYHFQRNFKLGDAWQASGADFLTSMRWSSGKQGYLDLYDSLRRLSGGKITITRTGSSRGDFHFAEGSLVSYLEIDHIESGSRTIRIKLAPETLLLWQSVGFTLVNWDERLSLSRPLSRFLHRYYSSHREPHALKLETVRQMTGSTVGEKAKFRQLLKAALQSLVDIGFLSAFWIDSDDKVHVRRRRPDELT